MRKILFVFSLLVVLNQANSQPFEKNFLGQDYNLYKNVLFIVNQSSHSGFDYTFYRKLEDCKELYGENVLYPSGKYNSVTDKKKLINKVFKVENIIDIKDEYDISENIVFLLRDTTSRKVIYFKYNPERSDDFPFLTSPIAFDVCSKVERTTDDFTGEVKFNSPVLEPFGLLKFIKGGNTDYFLWLETVGNTVNLMKKGVYVLFEDGTIWERNDADVDVSVDIYTDGWIYKSYINLKEDDLILFKTKMIRKFRLYIYDKDADPVTSKKFNAYVNCIVNSN